MKQKKNGAKLNFTNTQIQRDTHPT